MTIEQNVAIRKAADSFMELGIDLLAEELKLPRDGDEVADACRHFWKCVIDKACLLIGEQNPSEELQRWKDVVAELKAQQKPKHFVPDHNDPFPWGKFGPDKGDPRTYGQVPADYYAYLDREGCDDPAVAAYIEENFL